MFDVIAFDADDTLWHSENLYAATQAQLRQLLGGYAAPDQIDAVLHDTEMGNLPLYGYGIKGFALSMIEAALTLSAGRIQGHEVQQVLDLAKQMLTAKVQLIRSCRGSRGSPRRRVSVDAHYQGRFVRSRIQDRAIGVETLLPPDRDRQRQNHGGVCSVVSSSTTSNRRSSSWWATRCDRTSCPSSSWAAAPFTSPITSRGRTNMLKYRTQQTM